MGQSDGDGVLARPIERKKEKLFIDLKFTCYNVKKKTNKSDNNKKKHKAATKWFRPSVYCFGMYCFFRWFVQTRLNVTRTKQYGEVRIFIQKKGNQ